MRTNLILSLEIILKFEISQNNLEEYVAAAMHNIILKYLGNTSYNRQKKKINPNGLSFCINRSNTGNTSMMQKHCGVTVLVMMMTMCIWSQNFWLNIVGLGKNEPFIVV